MYQTCLWEKGMFLKTLFQFGEGLEISFCTPAPETISPQHSLNQNTCFAEHLWRVLLLSGKPLFFNMEAQQASSHPFVAPNYSHSSFQNYLRTIQWADLSLCEVRIWPVCLRNRVMKCDWTGSWGKKSRVNVHISLAKEAVHWGKLPGDE